MLGIRQSELQQGGSISSVGGLQHSYLEQQVTLAFKDDSRVHFYGIPVELVDRSEHNQDFPSIIGRDLLHRWRMRYEFSAGLLEFDVLTSDYSLDI